MKKLGSIFFFVILVSCVGYLYIIFPQDKKEVAQVNQQIILPDFSDDDSPEITIEQQQTQVEKPISNTTVDKIIAVATSKLNIPYKQAGTTDKGYDCSGLVMTSFAKQGVALPRASYEMAKKGTDVAIKNSRKGDLVFFKTNPNRNKINHVGLVTEVKNGVVYFIHSSIKKGVVINNLGESYYQKSYVKTKRVLKDE